MIGKEKLSAIKKELQDAIEASGKDRSAGNGSNAHPDMKDGEGQARLSEYVGAAQ